MIQRASSPEIHENSLVSTILWAYEMNGEICEHITQIIQREACIIRFNEGYAFVKCSPTNI